MPDTPVDFPAISFELRFARASGADAAAQLRHLYASSRQSRQHVFELCQFDLQLAFTGLGMARKDVEDELRAVDHALVQDALDVALLRRREIVIEEDQVGLRRGRCAFDFFKLAATN